MLHVERDILKGLPAKEFLRWEAYYQMQPFGEWRADVRAAQIAATAHNVMVGKESRVQVSDLIPDWLKNYDEAVKKAEQEQQPEPVKQTVEEQIAIARMWVAAFNAEQPEEPA